MDSFNSAGLKSKMTRVYTSIMLRIVAMQLCKIADTCLSTALDFHKCIALVPLFACGQHRTMVLQALACSLQNKSFARKIHPPTIQKSTSFEVLFGGEGWIRTIEVTDNRFTVCSLWPLGNLSVWSW